MRITQSMLYNRLMEDMNSNYTRLFEMQQRLSSGQKINKPSDDVLGHSRAMDYKVSINNNNQYLSNIDEAISQLSVADGAMGAAVSSLTRAKELAMQGANGTYGADELNALAEEVANLKDHLAAIANTKFRDRYIFSGFMTNLPAYDESSGDPAYSNGLMQNASSIEIWIDSYKEAKIAVGVPAVDAFSTDGGATSFMSSIDNLETALRNNDSTAIRAALGDIDAAMDKAINVRADIGSRINSLESKKDRFEDSTLNLKIKLSGVQDADVAESISELVRADTALQALRASAGRVISLSLMDYLR